MIDKKIEKIRIIHQDIDTVWSQWTTHEGLKTFFGKDNRIELAPNGSFEIYFLLENPIGLRGSEGCKVLSYLPKKFLSFSWNAPPEFHEARSSGHHTWVVVEFLPLHTEETQITLTQIGWLEGDIWEKVYDYFNKAWDIVLDNLSKTATPRPSEKMKKVTGIGGVFFKAKDPERLKEWYHTHLGLNTDQYGAGFEWLEIGKPQAKGFTQWSPFAEDTKYFAPSNKDFMLNFRVDNLELLLEELEKAGIKMVGELEVYDYGKFAHIVDLENNKIELWEPKPF